MLHVKRQITAPLRRVLASLAIGGGLLIVLAAPAAPADAATPCADEAIREQQHAAYLPDCRAYEQVSPAQKGDGEVEYRQGSSTEDPEQAALEGAGIAYSARGALPGSPSSGAFSSYLSSSLSLGSPWQTLALDPSGRLGGLEPNDEPRESASFDYFSPNLTCAIEGTAAPLTALPPGESANEYTFNLYVWDAEDGGYALIGNIKPKDRYAGGPVDGASAGCTHIIFESSEFPSLAPGKALYEWDQGTLRVASLLPDGTPARLTSSGEGESYLNPISSDGSRVFFTAESDEGIDSGFEDEVFVREDNAGTVEAKTVEASASQTSVVDKLAYFQGASSSGEQVFFTANYGLASTTSRGGPKKVVCKGTGEGCDLYDYDTADGKLTDISADVHAGEPGDADTEGAHVIGVLGMSEEGEVVYFSAAGQLVPGRGNPEAENEADKEANVYAYSGGQLSYVATIGATEAGGEAEVSEADKRVDAVTVSGSGSSYTVSRVSQDGSHLLFATSKPVAQTDGETYDNTDLASGEADFEDYEYSLASGAVTCVSCDPDGTQPHLHDNGDLFSDDGQFEAIAAGTPVRNLAEDGAVFFQTSNPVLPQATNETLNVYEWEPAGIGTCPAGQAAGCTAILDSGTDPDPTYFEGASANGENAYIMTYAQLAPEDQDSQRDVYDVRQNGGFLQTAPPAECSGEECQGPPPTQEGVLTPASTLAGANGNFPLTPLSSATPPASPPPATLTITSHSVKNATATIVAQVSAAGTVVASASGISQVSKSTADAQQVAFKLKLTKNASAALAKHPKKARKVKVTLVFTPTSGSNVVKRVTVSFKHPKAKKAARKHAKKASSRP